MGIDDVDYQQFSPPIEFGDLVLCYTDAMLECRRGDEMLGQSGLLDLLKTLDTSKPQSLISDLIDAIRRDVWNFDDDLTLLLFRPNGKRQKVFWYEHFIVPFRLFKWIGLMVRS